MNIVVTGASKGIGLQIVKSLAGLQAHKIIGISRNYKQLVKLKDWCSKNTETEFIPISYDFQQITFSEPKLSGIIRQHFNSIEILINNAGTLINKPFEIISAEEINRIFTVNYLAPTLLIKNLLPLLKIGKAHIINISSMAGYQESKKFAGLSHYSASKAALASITECLAEEYKNDKIVFNALALGSVQTEMLAEAFPGLKASTSPEEMGSYIANFAIEGKSLYNGRIIQVNNTTP